MKVAVLSDIHGNIEALKACFKYIDTINVEGIIWCGDFISDIPHSSEVLKFIKEKNKKYKSWLVCGNREQYIINYHNAPIKNWSLECNNVSLLLTYESLSNNDLDFIKKMPNSIVVDIPNTAPIYVTHERKNVKLNNSFDYKYVVFGHEHNQLIYSKRGIRFLNPGSVGLPIDGVPGASFMIIEYIDNHWQSKFYNIKYDISKPITSIKKSDINFNNIKWGDFLIATLETGRNYIGMYVNEVKRLAHELNISNNLDEVPNEVWDIARKNLKKKKKL